MADGQATKIIVPSEIANLSGTLTALAETVHSPAAPAHTQVVRNTAQTTQAARPQTARPQAPKQGIIDRIMGED